jgi:hypothetical protein
LIGAAVQRRRHAVLLFAILYLLSGSLNCLAAISSRLLRPDLKDTIRQLAFDGKIDCNMVPPRERLVGHWRVTDAPLSEYYFSSKGELVVVDEGRRTTGYWKLLSQASGSQTPNLKPMLEFSQKMSGKTEELRVFGCFLDHRKAVLFFMQNDRLETRVLEQLDLGEKPGP